AVAEEGHGQKPPPVLGGERPDEERGRADRADVMDGAGRGLGVFPKIERPELGIGLEALGHGPVYPKAPDFLRASISESVKPVSRNTSSLCWPTAGGGPALRG